MSAGEITGLVVAIGVVLGIVGGGIKYVISLVLDAYKQQADSTVDAKDQETVWIRERVEGRLDRIERAVDRLVTELDP